MESFPRRYEIYIANLDPTMAGEIRKSRPVVIVSHDAMNRLVETVVVCPLTTNIHPRWRGRIQVICDGRDAEIAVDQIRAISKRRLGRRIDRLSRPDALELRRVISEMYCE